MDIGTTELVLIFIVAVIVYGPQRLVEVARWLAKTNRGIRKISTDLIRSIKKMDVELTNSASEENAENTVAITSIPPQRQKEE
jgi:Sec-independent protein translocase protein TatA